MIAGLQLHSPTVWHDRVSSVLLYSILGLFMELGTLRQGLGSIPGPQNIPQWSRSSNTHRKSFAAKRQSCSAS